MLINPTLTYDLNKVTESLAKQNEGGKTTTFQNKLDEMLFAKMTIRKLLQTIYRKAIADRNKANSLFERILTKYSKAKQADDESKEVDLDPEINMMVPISKYMQFVKESNQQLLELAKVVERLINSNPATENIVDKKGERGLLLEDDDSWKHDMQNVS